MQIKIFVSRGYNFEAAMEGLEVKINEWLDCKGEPRKILKLEYAFAPISDPPCATVVIVID